MPELREEQQDRINLEPKRVNRFILRMEGTTIDEWRVTKVDFPKYDVRKGGWKDIKIVLFDFIGPSTSQKVMNEIVNNPREDWDLTLERLDPVGASIERWDISGEYVDIDFGRGDYGEDEIAKITLRFRIRECNMRN
jgi:hypothetical protein